MLNVNDAFLPASDSERFTTKEVTVNVLSVMETAAVDKDSMQVRKVRRLSSKWHVFQPPRSLIKAIQSLYLNHFASNLFHTAHMGCHSCDLICHDRYVVKHGHQVVLLEELKATLPGSSTFTPLFVIDCFSSAIGLCKSTPLRLSLIAVASWRRRTSLVRSRTSAHD